MNSTICKFYKSTDVIKIKGRRKLFQLLLVMFFINIFTIQNQIVNAQTSNKISLNQKNVSVEEVLNQIEDKSQYRFLFNKQLIDVDRKVTVNYQQADINTILSDLFKNTDVSFTFNGNQIVLSNLINKSENTQEKTVKISGTVLDTKGESIVGATITVKGSSSGTMSDVNGRFTLNVSENAVLTISFIGYKTKELKVDGKTDLRITLEEDEKLLDEVVVVGYGLQKKSSMTAAVTTVKTDDLLNVPRPNVLSAMQGRVAGLTINETSGQADSDPSILVRGVGTIDGATSPLILIDGVPTGTIGSISSYDIESISVLKDGAAAAIYGARAANGVILITTKSGITNDKKPVIQFNSYLGMQTLAHSPQTLNAYQYASLLNEVYENEGKDPVYSARDIEMYRNGETDDFHGNTNWKREALRNTAPILTNHLSVSGNGQLGHYYVSGEYVKQQGMIKNIDNYDRINLRANITSNINKHFKFQFMSNYIRTHRESGDLGYMFSEIQTASSTLPVRYSDGNWGSRIYANGDYLWESGNPAKIIDLYGPKETYWNTLNTSGSLSYSPINDLVFRALLSYRNSWSDSQDYNKSWFSWDPVAQSVSQSDQATLTESWGKEYKYDFQLTADYAKSFDEHNLKLLAGYSQESLRSDNISAYRKNFINNSIQELNAGDAATQTNSGYADQWAFASLFGRFNYSYDNKYLFEANLRYDGSSRFADGKRWGLFPSMSLGWNIAQEEFLSQYTFIDNIKLRLSWGQLGNAEKVGLYQWFSGITSGAYYNFDNDLVFGTRPGYLANTDLVWETTTSYNIGLDGSFYRGRLNFEVDFWQKNTDDVLLSAPISTIIGSPTSTITVNSGKVASHGFDLSVGSMGKIVGDLRYDVRLSFTAWNSWVVDLKERATAFSTEFRPGEDLGNYYGYECVGIINDEATLDAYKKLENVAPQTALGDLQYKDQNGDGKLDYLDYVKIGNFNIKNNLGLNIALSYKGFDTQVFFQGAFNVDRAITGSSRTSFINFAAPDANQLDRWTEQNRNADALYPRLRKEFLHNTDPASSFWIKDASYLKLKNLQFGYNFPTSIVSKVGIEALRLYISGTNLFTIAPDYLEGYDPETDMNPSRYPTLRVFSVGFNLKF